MNSFIASFVATSSQHFSTNFEDRTIQSANGIPAGVMMDRPTSQQQKIPIAFSEESKMKCRRRFRRGFSREAVFSFAIVLIALMSSRTPLSTHLVAHAWEGTFLDPFDLISSLQDDGWYLVGHLSDNNGQSSDGGESALLPTALLPSTSFGNYTCLPLPYSESFQLPFPVVAGTCICCFELHEIMLILHLYTNFNFFHFFTMFYCKLTQKN